MAYKNDHVGAYVVQNLETGETYVGSGQLRKRANEHFRALENNKHANYKFQEAFNRNPNFVFIGKKTETREQAFDIEQKVIDEFQGDKNLLNISTDARAAIFYHTDETKRKIAQKATGRRITEETRQKLRERIFTPETLKNMSDAKMGHKHSEETKNKISEGNKGKTVSDEVKKHLSVKLTGRPGTRIGHVNTAETRAKISEKLKGKKHSEETKLKMSLTRTGQKRTEEQKQNMSRSRLGKKRSPETLAKIAETRAKNK